MYNPDNTQYNVTNPSSDGLLSLGAKQQAALKYAVMERDYLNRLRNHALDLLTLADGWEHRGCKPDFLTKMRISCNFAAAPSEIEHQEDRLTRLRLQLENNPLAETYPSPRRLEFLGLRLEAMLLHIEGELLPELQKTYARNAGNGWASSLALAKPVIRQMREDYTQLKTAYSNCTQISASR